jgi:hypothetical protein
MIQTLLPSLMPVVGNVLDRFFPNKEEALKAQRELEAALIANAAQLNLGQLQINKEEAKSKNIWVSGWRPFIGWICGVALAWHFVGVPVMTFVIAFAGLDIPELPTFDMDSLMTVLLGMLGLGGLRSFEKYKGLTK